MAPVKLMNTPPSPLHGSTSKIDQHHHSPLNPDLPLPQNTPIKRSHY